MAKVFIVYHSQSGNTEEMAKAISEGASAAGASVVLKKAVDARADDIVDCDIVAIGTPSYFGYMAGMVKDYFDRVWVTIRAKMENKPYVTFGSKGGGGAQAVDSVEKICDGMKMSRRANALLGTRKPTDEVLAECRELGKKLAHPERMEKPKVEEPKL